MGFEQLFVQFYDLCLDFIFIILYRLLDDH